MNGAAMCAADAPKMKSVTFNLLETELEEFNACLREFRTKRRFDHHLEVRRQDVQQGAESLLKIIQFVSGQGYGCGGAHVMARVIASIYNGDRVKCSLMDLSRLDFVWAEHCMNVMRLHVYARQEIHHFIENGGEAFERIIKAYGLEKRRRAA